MVADQTHYSGHRMTKSKSKSMVIKSDWFVFYSWKIDCSDKSEYIQAKAA